MVCLLNGALAGDIEGLRAALSVAGTVSVLDNLDDRRRCMRVFLKRFREAKGVRRLRAERLDAIPHKIRMVSDLGRFLCYLGSNGRMI